MKSALLTSLPKYDLVAPPAAIGVLQGVAQQHNIGTEVLDFNLYLKNNLDDHEWDSIDDWCIFLKEDISDDLKNKILNLWDRALVEKMPANCEYLIISLFSYWSLYIGRLIIEHEGKKIKPYKLIVGGNGVSSKFPDTNLYVKDWNDSLRYIEYLIIGEGEKPLAEIFSQGKVNYDEQNLDSFPFPSYVGFDFNQYKEQKVYITGSRGCVRRCTFCDIQNIWPKFRFRSAENIVEEIKKHYYDHGITRFDFTDSLINGSVSNFYKFNSLLAEEKEKNSDLKNIGYLGQAICRPRNQMPPHHYEAMHYAGCKQITVGIESFSEDVRNHMKKKFSDEDIEYHLEQCGYWRIPNVWLMIVGYPTETIDDHKKNLSDLKKYSRYAKTGIIELMRWGTTMHLMSDTPIVQDKYIKELQITNGKENKIFFDPYSPYSWLAESNPTLTVKERIKRRIELHKETVRLGYPQPEIKNELNTMVSMSKIS